MGLICATAALFAGPGYRSLLLPLRIGLQLIRWMATPATAGIALAALAVCLSWLAGTHRGFALLPQGSD